MPSVSCPCGTTFQAAPGDAACPECGAIHTVDAAPVAVCSCGEAVELPSREPGARRVCPACGRLVEARAPGVGPPASGPIPAGLRLVLSLLLPAAFLPLLLGALAGPRDDRARIEQVTAVKTGPLRTSNAVDDWFKALREHNVRSVPGAAVENGSATPWILGVVAAEVFWAYLLLAFPWGGSTLRRALGAGALALVAAGGALLLLKFLATLDFAGYRPRGKSAIFYYLARFLGFSYQAGIDPANGFLKTWFSFTFGAGLLLSIARALPVLLWYRKSETLDVRGAVAWGLVAGASAGAMQAGFYGGSFYDGIAGARTYVEMIVSGIAVSAVCGGLSALVLWRLEEDVLAMDRWYEWLILVLIVGGAGSAVHAAYDTLWKGGSSGGAFVVALAAYLVFFVGYAWAVRKEKEYAAA